MAHLVLIDDSRLARDFLLHALTRAGFIVTPAIGAADGLDAIRRVRPDAVLLDLDLPGRDGFSCLADIRADPVISATPVFMVSASPPRDAIVRLAQIGVQGIIVKGDDMVPQIVRRIRQITTASLAPPPPHAPAPLPSAVSHPHPAVVTAHHSPHVPRLEPRGDANLSHTEPLRHARRSGIPPARGTVQAAVPALSPAEEADSLAAAALQINIEGVDLERAMDELRKIKPLMTRSELLERTIDGEDLRAIKPAVQQVLSLTGSAGASLDSIAKAIKQDQALSVKVLKIANSPLYARGERVDNVQKAVARIGVEQIRATVLSLSFIDRFGSSSMASRMKADWYWEHSIACALIASQIARIRSASSDTVDALFTAGLLHDIGRVIYAERLGEEYAAVIDAADRLEMPLETVESRMLLVNHADLTDRLLRKWNFSPELVNPIALHHLSLGNIRSTAPRMAESVATLGLANRIAHALLLGCSGNDVLYPIEDFVDFLKLSPTHIGDICRTIPEQTTDLKLQMLTHGAEVGPSLLDETRAQLHVPARPLLVSLQPGADAVGILLERLNALSPAAPGTPPNLAIVRVNNQRDRAQLLSRLRAAEAAADVKNLPTLIVGVGAGCFFADGALGDRPMQQTVIPLRLTRLVRAINELIAAPAHAEA